MGLPRTENWDLFSQIHHVFLPPRLPEHSSSDVFDGRALLETVCDELLRFRSYFDDDGGVDIDRCIRSFGCLLRPFMETDKEQAEAEMDALAQQMVELKDNGMPLVYSRQRRVTQNKILMDRPRLSSHAPGKSECRSPRHKRRLRDALRGARTSYPRRYCHGLWRARSALLSHSRSHGAPECCSRRYVPAAFFQSTRPS